MNSNVFFGPYGGKSLTLAIVNEIGTLDLYWRVIREDMTEGCRPERVFLLYLILCLIYVIFWIEKYKPLPNRPHAHTA